MRKNILGLILLLAQLWACQPSNTVEDEQGSGTLQNVVVIVGDDHSYKVTGSYGNEIIRTPNIDRLAVEGVRFTNAYANAPICNASRQSMLTGTYPHTTQVNLLFTPFPDHHNFTIAEYLRKKGYKTALIGKNHFNNWAWGMLYEGGSPDHGFDVLIDNTEYRNYHKEKGEINIPDSIETYSRSSDNTIANLKNARTLPMPCYDEDCKGTYLARQCIEFIKANKEQPFLLWVGFNEPHAPFNFPIEYRNKYDPEKMPLPTGSPEDDRWQPEIFKGLTETERRGIVASYYTSVEYMDKNVGLILEEIEKQGLNENTLVIYVGDQGYLLNEHKRFEKHTMWKEAIKTPLVIRGGALANEGSDRNQLVELVDLMPTALDFLGYETPSQVQGKSLFTILNHRDSVHRNLVFAEYLEDNMAMVADHEWKYIFSTGQRDLGLTYETGKGPLGLEHRLYNLKEDPEETTNLAGNEKHLQVLQELQNGMLQKFMETHPEAGKVPPELTLEGKLVWFCQPRDIGGEPDSPPLRVFKAAQ